MCCRYSVGVSLARFRGEKNIYIYGAQLNANLR